MLEHKKVLCQCATLAGRNPDIYNALKQICIKWSNGSYNTLNEAYEYLKENKADEVEDFINMLAYMVRVSN